MRFPVEGEEKEIKASATVASGKVQAKATGARLTN